MLRPRMTRRLSPPLVLILLAGAWGLAGCGDEKPARSDPPAPLELVLDFAPNAAHAGTYLTRARGYDEDEGVRLSVRAPSSSTDSVKLLRTGRADLAYLDIHDLALADARRPGELIAVMALVQRPLAALLTAPEVRRPRELEGRRAGVSGLPSDEAVLASIVRGDGGDPARVRTTTIGFQAVAALLAGRVDAATGFWSAEGRALRERRPQSRIFKVDEFGAPPYPELVLVATAQTLRERRERVRAAVAALREGHDASFDEPGAAIDALIEAAPGVDRATASHELAALTPALRDEQGRFGVLDRATLDVWAEWERRFGIVERRPDVSRLFATELSRAG